MRLFKQSLIVPSVGAVESHVALQKFISTGQQSALKTYTGVLTLSKTSWKI